MSRLLSALDTALVADFLMRCLLRVFLLLPGLDGVLRDFIQWYLTTTAKARDAPKPQIFGLVLVTSDGLDTIRPREDGSTTTLDVVGKVLSWTKDLEHRKILSAPLEPSINFLDDDDKTEVATSSGSSSGEAGSPEFLIDCTKAEADRQDRYLESDEQPRIGDGHEEYVLEGTLIDDMMHARGVRHLVFARRIDHNYDPVAIKVINKLKAHAMNYNRRCIMTEIKAMKKATGSKAPFVAPLISAWEDEMSVYMVMPLYCEDLFQLVDRKFRNPVLAPRLDPEQLRLWAAELVDALYHLHSLGIAHRDIKLENILVACNGRLVLTDFGLAAIANDFEGLKLKRFQNSVGSPSYRAPEVLMAGKDVGAAYDYKCDVWSLGKTIYNIFYDACMTELDWDRWDSRRPLDVIEDLSLRNLLKKMLEPSPALRWDAEKLMADPYFNKIDWNKLERGVYEHKILPLPPTPNMLKSDFWLPSFGGTLGAGASVIA